VNGLLLKVIDLLAQLMSLARGRPRLHVRILEDNPEREIGALRFEVENRRLNPTSLDPEITITYYSPNPVGQVRKQDAVFYLREEHRRLEPFQPRILNASADKRPACYLFSWYRTYRFRPTAGPTSKVRVRNCMLQPLGGLRFAYELAGLLVFKRTERGGPSNIDDYRRMIRAQGPH